MIAVDTNILIYAHREELPQHARSVAWLKALAEGPAPWGIPAFCLGEFLRIATHPRIFDPPSTLAQATGAIENLLASPSLRVLTPGEDYAMRFLDCARAADARGNLAFDAQIAAVCHEHGCDRILTLDRDFARFKSLRTLSIDDPLP